MRYTGGSGVYVYFTETECETCKHMVYDSEERCNICTCKKSEEYGRRVDLDDCCTEYEGD